VRRRQLRAVLSAYLDLVVLAADGGAGIDQALTDSARVCRGWAAEQIRAALRTARLTRTSPWTALQELGQRTGVPELVELAATAALAGTEGARVRASLSARAAALRTRQLAEVEHRANTATEHMTLPMFLLAAGFVLLIAFPALAGIAGVGDSLP
jgi:Flp pilus assembly protein TadB